jgi:hypothetical protein
MDIFHITRKRFITSLQYTFIIQTNVQLVKGKCEFCIKTDFAKKSRK